MSNLLEGTIAVASIVSAAGGCAAAYAAFLSAKSAREATKAAEASTRQSLIREASRTAATIIIEGNELVELERATQSTIRMSMVAAGLASSSGHELSAKQATDAARRAAPLIEAASAFASLEPALASSTSAELERHAQVQWQNLQSLRALAREIDGIRIKFAR